MGAFQPANFELVTTINKTGTTTPNVVVPSPAWPLQKGLDLFGAQAVLTATNMGGCAVDVFLEGRIRPAGVDDDDDANWVEILNSRSQTRFTTTSGQRILGDLNQLVNVLAFSELRARVQVMSGSIASIVNLTVTVKIRAYYRAPVNRAIGEVDCGVNRTGDPADTLVPSSSINVATAQDLTGFEAVATADDWGGAVVVVGLYGSQDGTNWARIEPGGLTEGFSEDGHQVWGDEQWMGLRAWTMWRVAPVVIEGDIADIDNLNFSVRYKADFQPGDL